MAYSRNFGMRSFENVVRDGRFRVPTTGNPIKLGAPVMLDAANPGFVKAATEAVAPSANCGIAVYEHIQNKSDALTTTSDTPYDEVPLGQYVQMMHGPGTKVWFKNTADKTMYDGRVRTGVTILDNGSGAAMNLGTLNVGDGLVPAGNGRWRKTDGTGTADVGGTAWLVVEQVNTANGVVEARFVF